MVQLCLSFRVNRWHVTSLRLAKTKTETSKCWFCGENKADFLYVVDLNVCLHLLETRYENSISWDEKTDTPQARGSAAELST